MKYVEDFNEGLFLVLKQIIEEETLNGSTTESINLGIDDPNYRFHTIYHWIDFDNDFIIKKSIFHKIIDSLIKEKLIIGTYHEFEDFGMPRNKEMSDLVMAGISIGQKYPIFPPPELIFYGLCDFKVPSLQAIKDKINEVGMSTDKKNALEAIDSLVYKVQYNMKRELTINGILLAKPDFNSQNEIAIDYIVRNPNRKILRNEISGLNKKFNSILSDLGFKNELKELFFSNCSKDALIFNNPITKQWIAQEEFKHLQNLNMNTTISEIRRKKGIRNRQK